MMNCNRSAPYKPQANVVPQNIGPKLRVGYDRTELTLQVSSRCDIRNFGRVTHAQ